MSNTDDTLRKHILSAIVVGFVTFILIIASFLAHDNAVADSELASIAQIKSYTSALASGKTHVLASPDGLPVLLKSDDGRSAIKEYNMLYKRKLLDALKSGDAPVFYSLNASPSPSKMARISKVELLEAAKVAVTASNVQPEMYMFMADVTTTVILMLNQSQR